MDAKQPITAPDMVWIVSYETTDSITGHRRKCRAVFGAREACDNFVATLTYAAQGSVSVVGSTLYMRWPGERDANGWGVPLNKLTASGIAADAA